MAGKGWLGKQRYNYIEIPSTNTEAARLAEAGASHGTIVVAESQTQGRGRRGRQWSSSSGKGLFFSIILKPDIPVQDVSMLTLVAALAVKNAIGQVSGLKPQIKWPNDLVLSGKKVCGILMEMKVEEGKICHVIAGIGINIKKQQFPPNLQQIATSIEAEGGKEILAKDLLEAVLESFGFYYGLYEKTLDMSLMLQEYQRSLVNLDRQVKVLDPLGDYIGIARGINGRGELLVECEGKMHTVNSGEVSVRGVYGYV